MIPTLFQNPSLIRLIKSIRADSNGDDRCLISRLNVSERNSVKLPCGHVFHIDYYNNIKKKQNCPYCGKSYNVSDIERSCKHMECSEMTAIQNGICKKHNKSVCTYIITKGKRKGINCGAKTTNDHSLFCSKHCGR